MSTKKPRKSLDDALAREFVYSERQGKLYPDPDTSPVTGEVSPANSQESALEKLPILELLAEKHSSEHPLQAETSAIDNQKEPDLMTKLQVVPKEATVRLTVDLSESMHRKLSIMAAKTGRKKADIVRVLLTEVVKDIKE